MSRKLSLPGYAKLVSKGVVEVFADKFYPEILNELGQLSTEDLPDGVSAKEVDDEFWLETAFGVMKRDVQLALLGTEENAPRGGALRILVTDQKAEGVSNYALSIAPKSKVDAAKHIGNIYRALRGV